MELYQLLAVVDRETEPRLEGIFTSAGAVVGLSQPASGTAGSDILARFGLASTEKRIAMTIATGAQQRMIFQMARKFLYLDIPGNGILAAIPVKAVAGRVAAARERQMARQGCLNEDLRASRIEATLSSEARETLENIMDRMGLSCRAYTRILKMARTIADLSYDDEIQPRHVAEASSYRFLDRMTTKAND